MSYIKHSKVRNILRCLQVMPMFLIILRAILSVLLLFNVNIPMDIGVLALIFSAVCIRLLVLSINIKTSIWSKISYVILVVYAITDFITYTFFEHIMLSLPYNIAVITLANGLLISFLIYIYNVYERRRTL